MLFSFVCVGNMLPLSFGFSFAHCCWQFLAKKKCQKISKQPLNHYIPSHDNNKKKINNNYHFVGCKINQYLVDTYSIDVRLVDKYQILYEMK